MKLPFTFGVRLIFRLLFPGLVLAVFFYPAAERAFLWLGLRPSAEILFPLLSVPLGWIVSLLDLPIYMLFEGRRFWPAPIAKWGLRKQATRLSRWQDNYKLHREKASAHNAKATNKAIDDPERKALLEAASYHEQQSIEAALKVAQYPLNDNRRREAVFPTTMGNIIGEYETYSTRKYGLDGVFFWYRLWIGLPKDLREEIDEIQASVDSLIYVSVCLIAGAFLLLLYAISDRFVDLHLLSAPWGRWWWLLSLAALALSYGLYRLSLSAQDQYGRYFKAMFDRFQSELNLQPALEFLAETVGDPRIRLLKGRSANMAVWRFLQWDRFRQPGEAGNLDIADLEPAALRDKPLPFP